jgi:hypothetical protein
MSSTVSPSREFDYGFEAVVQPAFFQAKENAFCVRMTSAAVEGGVGCSVTAGAISTPIHPPRR